MEFNFRFSLRMSSDEIRKMLEELANAYTKDSPTSKGDKSTDKKCKADDTGFNENLKLMFFSSSTQPGIIWEPVEENRHFECFSCGAKATSFYLREETEKKRQKLFACNTCIWKVPGTAAHNTEK